MKKRVHAHMETYANSDITCKKVIVLGRPNIKKGDNSKIRK